MKLPHFLPALALAIFTSVSPAEDFRVLPHDSFSDKKFQMMRTYQRAQVHAALDNRLAELEAAIGSPESIASYQKKRREFLSRAFGPLPERTPLNAQVAGIIECDGYRVEKIIFESQPRFYVTASLYRPDGDGPFPAVLFPCGHSKNGKAYSAYQKACILLAKNGFITLCFDPIGQGERRQLIGPEPHPNLKLVSEHNHLGVAPILLGRTLGAMMVWDGMRGIDYLCDRPDVDPKRIGCTGNSGGGNLTSYLMAFDDRIVAAAPGCFMTTHRRKNEKPGPGDAEQNLFAQIRDGFDHPDFILTRAPRPTLILSATQDYVPIEGAWEAFRQAKRAYTTLGYPERIDLVETDGKHGLSEDLREATVEFMARWMQGRQIEVNEEEDVGILTDAQLRVTHRGQVNWLPEARSVFDVFEESERVLAGNRPKLTNDLVRMVTGIRLMDEIPEPEMESVGGKLPEKLIFRPEPGIVLPSLLWRGGQKEPLLFAPGDGMNSMVEKAKKLHSEGHPVLIVEVRDTGETKTQNWRFYGADFYIGQMLGRSWLAMRTEDLLVTSRWLARACGAESVTMIATGEAGPAALHARFLEPELISSVNVSDCLNSWKPLMHDRQAHRHIHQAVHGALRYYDLADLNPE